MKEGGSVGVCKDTSSAADGCVNKKNRIYFFKNNNNNCTETDPWTPHFYHHILLRLTCFGYFCMGACLLCDCIWMYTLKISVHMMDVNPHKLGVLSLCVRPSGEIPSPPYPSGCPHMISLCHMCQVTLWRWAEVTAIVCIYRTSQDTTQSSTKIPGMHVHTLFTSQSCPKEQKNWFCLYGFVT